MAVYTHLTDADIAAHLARYDIGELKSARGIAEGVENTNYLVETTSAKFILTLFEKRTNVSDLPFFMQLMEHLAQRGIACPKPIHAKDGEIIQSLQGKSAVIVSFLNGKGVTDITSTHTSELGSTLARMHLGAANSGVWRANSLSLAGWKELIEKIGGRANEVQPGLAAELNDEWRWLAKHWPQRLPAGVVHADLFPDNVFFEGKKLSGVIDFYFACTDFWMYDLAITVNAWCFDKAHVYHSECSDMLFKAYQKVRAIGENEWHALPVLARGAALRFLLTRTHDWVFHEEGALVTPKDPLEYLAKLRYWQGIDNFSV